jgi:hypothetical protein
VNNLSAEKNLAWRGDNEFLAAGGAKCLRYGIRPAKKFSHKVPADSQMRLV